ERERAAPPQWRQIGQHRAQADGRHEVRHHQVRERIGGHRRGVEGCIVEVDHPALLRGAAYHGRRGVEPRGALTPARGRAICRPDMDNPGADIPTQRGPLPAFRAMVAAGELAPDASQEHVARHLQALWTRLRGYDPSPRPPNGLSLFARLLRRVEPPEDRPNGLYIVGEVGRGKSMLMD